MDMFLKPALWIEITTLIELLIGGKYHGAIFLAGVSSWSQGG